MKGALILVFSFSLFSACGTEVGNGVDGGDGAEKPPTPTSASPDIATESTSSPEAKISLKDPRRLLFVACASPIAEIVNGDYETTSGELALSVQSLSSSIRDVVYESSTVRVTLLGSNSQNLAITSEPSGPDLSCSPVQTTVLADGTSERTLVFSSGASLKWQINNSLLIRIQILTETTADPYILLRRGLTK